jgi:hypothetical protein
MIDSSKIERLRLQALGAVVMICVQAGLGMFVNLFVTIPRHHSGSVPSEYFSGSFHSVTWAITHGAVALVLHAILGILLAIMVVGIVVRAMIIGHRAIATWSILGALFTVGAGFNGASFLDFNTDVSSFVMVTLALAALLCYVIVIYLPGTNDSPKAKAEGPATSRAN